MLAPPPNRLPSGSGLHGRMIPGVSGSLREKGQCALKRSVPPGPLWSDLDEAAAGDYEKQYLIRRLFFQRLESSGLVESTNGTGRSTNHESQRSSTTEARRRSRYAGEQIAQIRNAVIYDLGWYSPDPLSGHRCLHNHFASHERLLDRLTKRPPPATPKTVFVPVSVSAKASIVAQNDVVFDLQTWTQAILNLKLGIHSFLSRESVDDEMCRQ